MGIGVVGGDGLGTKMRFPKGTAPIVVSAVVPNDMHHPPPLRPTIASLRDGSNERYRGMACDALPKASSAVG